LGCSGADYQAQRDFEDQCWSLADTLRFEQDLKSHELEPKVGIDLTLGSDFRTQNLYLKLRYARAGQAWQELLLHDTLMTPVGAWRAEVNHGTVDWHMEPQLALPEAGRYRFELYHYMRDTLLCSVREVGFSLR